VALVFVEDWQHECCGAPFAVGDDVSWPLRADLDPAHLAVRLGADLAGRITDHVERHVDGVPEVRLRVRRIRAAFCADEPDPAGGNGVTSRLVPGTTVLRGVHSVGRTHEVFKDLRWLGYVVDAEPSD
jgi:hypothetical protein